MRDERWRVLERELCREVPPNPDLVASIMERVRAEPRPGALQRTWRWLLRPRGVRVAPAHAVALALLALAVPLGWRARSGEAPVADVPRVAPAGADTQAVQFVLVAPGASSVSLVGDFNDWDPSVTPLERTGASGVWSAVLPLADGRYLYAFVVDGSTWIPDASAPRGPEDEFGGASSVMLVGDTQ